MTPKLARRLPGLLLAALLSWACRSVVPPDGVALLGATLIDGGGGSPLADAVIVVRGSRIEWVGSQSGFELPPRTREVDVRGRWIIPGLIDAHAHLSPAADWAPARYLAWGTTTVRDVHGALNSILPLRSRANGGDGPRVYAAGAMIDGVPATLPDAIAVSSEREARKAVDRLVSAGVDFIKVYTRVDQSLLRAILDEAGTFKVSVAAHLGMTDAVTAARAGVRAIEHLSGIPEAALSERSALLAAHYRGFFPGWTAFERSWNDVDSVALSRVARVLAEERVILIPTLALHETLSRLNLPGEPRDQDQMPNSAGQKWNVSDVIHRAGWNESDFTAFRRARSAQDQFLRIFTAAGGRVATGTDAANHFMAPGASEHRELELLVRAGLTPHQALTAATRNGAVLLGVDSIGHLASGKAADLVVLGRDPLKDIRNTRSIEAVMFKGRLLDPDSIRAGW